MEFVNNGTNLTDEQIKELSSTIEESKNETDALYAEIDKTLMEFDNSDSPLEEGEAQYMENGIIMDNNNSEELDFEHFANIDNALEEIIADNLKEKVSEDYNLSDEEAVKFINVITRIRKKEKFKVYDELPDVLKEQIDKIVQTQEIPLNQRSNYLNTAAQFFVEELMTDVELDSLSIDLEKAMKELIPSPMEMYSEFNRDYIENEFIKVAEKIKDENPNTANNLLAMRKGYIDSYTFETMYELFKNPKIQKNVRRADVLWSRTNIEYLRLAHVCKFNLYSLQDLHKSLNILGYSDIEAKRIITLFVYTYTNEIEDYNDEKEYNDIYRNSFANYFEVNLRSLSINTDLLSDFSKQIKEDLRALSNHINNTIAEKEAELSNKKNKKKG